MDIRKLLFLPPIALGIAGFIWMSSGSDAPEEDPEPLVVAVRTQTIAATPVLVTAVGYGRVEAERSWSGIAEVQGRIDMLSEGLAQGSIVEAGDTLLEINRTDYELSRQKALANIATANAQLSELERGEANARDSLAVQQRILAVAQAEFKRVESVVSKGSDSAAALDAARKTLLSQQANVTTLENSLALYPSQQASAQATLAVREAELAEAERSLEKTRLTAPFRARVSSVSVEVGQFVRTGDTLITLDSTDAVEIVAEVQPRSFEPLVATALGKEFAMNELVDTSQAVQILERANITATVSMPDFNGNALWQAEIVRMRGTMDSETGAMGFVVRVPDPLLASPEQRRPPLNAGAFVAVTFSSPPLHGLISIPRDALRHADNGSTFVYLADEQNRLAVSPVQTGPIIGADVVILAGLEPGDSLVLSDPRPSVPGIQLAPVTSSASRQDR